MFDQSLFHALATIQFNTPHIKPGNVKKIFPYIFLRG